MKKLTRNLMIAGISILTGGAIAAGLICYANIKKPDVIVNGQVVYEYMQDEDAYEAVGLSNTDKTKIKSIKVASTYKDKKVVSIKKGAFAGCSNIEEITIPFIGHYLAYTAGTELNEGMFGWIFGSELFDGCGGLTWQECYTTNTTDVYSDKFAIPKSLKTVNVTNAVQIPAGAFSCCQNIEAINITKYDESNAVESIGNKAFYNCSSLLEFDLNISDSLKSIEKGAFENCYLLSQIIIPSSVQDIDEDAFKNCISSTIAKIPSNVIKMGKNAFYNHIGGIILIEATEEEVAQHDWDDEWTQSSTSMVYNYNSSESTIYTNDWLVLMCGNQNQRYGYLAQWMGEWQQSSITVPASVTYNGQQIPIKCIGGNCFKENIYIEQVTIEEGVEIIYQDTFKGCTALKYVNLPNSLTGIRSEAFMDCTSLVGHIDDGQPVKKINLDSTNLTWIGDRAFKNCTSILDVKFSDNTTYIGEEAFAYCSHLCADCTVETENCLALPANLETMGKGAFKYCFKYAPESFTGSYYYPTIKISSNLTTIPENAFERCGVRNLRPTTGDDAGTIYPKYVRVHIDLNDAPLTKISNYAFNECWIANLRNARNTHLEYIGDYAFCYAQPTSDLSVEGGQQSLQIDQECKYIGQYAFAWCSTIKELKFNTAIDNPDGSSTEKNYNSLEFLGQRAFYYCNNSDFTELDLSPCINLYTNYTRSIAMPDSSSRYAFSQCQYLQKVKLPGYLPIAEGEERKEWYGKGEQFTELPVCFFEGCINLGKDVDKTPVYIPKQVVTLRESAFNGCNFLHNVYIQGNIQYYGSSLFRNNFALENIKKLNHTDYSTGEITFASDLNRSNLGSDWYYGCASLNNGPLPYADRENYTYSIKSTSYYGNTKITSYNIPKNISSIDSSAFQGCSSLQTLNFVNTTYYTSTPSLTTINANAFYGCTNLLDFDLGSTNVTSIRDGAFYSCTSLGTTTGESGSEVEHKFYLPNNKISMGLRPFEGWNTSTQKIYFRYKNVNGATEDVAPEGNFYLNGTTTWEFVKTTVAGGTDYWTCSMCGTSGLKFYFEQTTQE